MNKTILALTSIIRCYKRDSLEQPSAECTDNVADEGPEAQPAEQEQLPDETLDNYLIFEHLNSCGQTVAS